jgi:nonsense-mediated mRNA decay protein 3
MSTAIEIPCCLCGTYILPNGANQCSSCLAQTVDLKGILRRGPGGGDLIVHQCRKCRCLEKTPGNFKPIEWESPELMAMCLKHIPALTSSDPKISVVDSAFVWTEPNSMRIRLRLTVRADVSSVRIQQRCLVEFIIKWRQCPDCNREFTNRQWQAIVQLRQRREESASKSGLAVLEMALARNDAVRKHVQNIQACKNGFDFYFLGLSEAQQFSSYLARVTPLKIKTTQKLVSTDVKNNIAHIKHTVTCDMVPFCRDDLVLIHRSAAKGGGSLRGRLGLVTQVASVVHLVDASPRQDINIVDAVNELAAESYYMCGAEKMYQVLSSADRLVRFVVLDLELISRDHRDSPTSQYRGPRGEIPKYALADVEIVRESDFGRNDETLRCITHLGHLIQVGDVVLGYDLSASVISGALQWSIDHKCLNASFILPDVVLVKKVRGGDNHTAESSPQNFKRTKKKGKRNRREEKKVRELEEAAGRMGFLQSSDTSEVKTSSPEIHDPDFEEDLLAAERELAIISEVQVEESTES